MRPRFRASLSASASILLLATLLPAAPVAAAPTAQLIIEAPDRVALGEQIELTITSLGARNVGGYEAALSFDTSAAHFGGIRQLESRVARSGRGIGSLGPVERGNGVYFGARAIGSRPARYRGDRS